MSVAGVFHQLLLAASVTMAKCDYD